jgi:hypothetical protein
MSDDARAKFRRSQSLAIQLLGQSKCYVPWPEPSHLPSAMGSDCLCIEIAKPQDDDAYSPRLENDFRARLNGRTRKSSFQMGGVLETLLNRRARQRRPSKTKVKSWRALRTLHLTCTRCRHNFDERANTGLRMLLCRYCRTPVVIR